MRISCLTVNCVIKVKNQYWISRKQEFADSMINHHLMQPLQVVKQK